jgi:hypothetical protein
MPDEASLFLYRALVWRQKIPGKLRSEAFEEGK